MTEQEKLDYYEKYKQRPSVSYVFLFLSYQTGGLVKRFTQSFSTPTEAHDAAQIAVENEQSVGRIVLLCRQHPQSDTVEEPFIEPLGMFWPEGVKEAVQTFFEVL